MKQIFIIICLSIIYKLSLAQSRAIQLKDPQNRLFGNNIKILQSGDVIITGIASNDDNSHTFYSKIDENANVIWSNIEKDAHSDNKGFIVDIIELTNGNIVLLVNTDTNFNLPYLLCLDTAGKIVWKLRLNSFDGINEAYSMLEDNANFYVIGSTTDWQIALLKFDENGNILWSKKISNPDDKFTFDAQMIIKNNKITIGCKSNKNSKYLNIELLQVDKINGTLLSQKNIQGIADTLVFENISYNDNEIYVYGNTSLEPQLSNPFIIRLDDNFNIVRNEKFISTDKQHFNIINLKKYNNLVVGIAEKYPDANISFEPRRGFIKYNPVNSSLDYFGIVPYHTSSKVRSVFDIDKNNNVWQIGNTADGDFNIGLIKTQNIEKISFCKMDKRNFTTSILEIKTTTPTFSLSNYAMQVSKVSSTIEQSNLSAIDNCLYCSTKTNKIELKTCEGQVFKFGSKNYIKAGTYKDTMQVGDCNSFFEIKIEIKPKAQSSISKFICTTQPSIKIAQKTYTKEGIFTDTLKTQTGCDSILNITIKSLTDFKVSLGEDKEILQGDEITLNAQSDYANIIKKYTWLPVGTSSCDTCKSISIAPNKNQSFVVQASVEGCTAIDSINIKVLSENLVFIPNAFSPNNDQINDIFRPFTADAVAEIENFSIYDRWGNLLYEATNYIPNDPKIGWDGTFKGSNVSEDIYIYTAKIRLKNGKIQKFAGDVKLFR